MSDTQRRVIVLDTSAFIAGFDPFSINEEEYTVPTVKEEISEKSTPYLRFKTAEESGKIKLRIPEQNFLEQVKECATSVGDAFFLSRTDQQVLALALQLKTRGYHPMIATDDYSIQNVARKMNIESVPLATFGIRTHLRWMRYCPGCYRKYASDYKLSICEICGTRLKRKSLKNQSHTNDAQT